MACACYRCGRIVCAEAGEDSLGAKFDGGGDVVFEAGTGDYQLIGQDVPLLEHDVEDGRVGLAIFYAGAGEAEVKMGRAGQGNPRYAGRRGRS